MTTPTLRYPPEMVPYARVIRTAVWVVQSKVAGADRIPAVELEQEALILALKHHRAWEREAHTNLMSYAKGRLWRMLADHARSVLSVSGEYGKVGPARTWKLRPAVFDPASRQSAPTHGWDDGGARVPLALSAEDVWHRDSEPDDTAPYIAGRSPRWAQIFEQTYPAAADEFLDLGAWVKPPKTSWAVFHRQLDAARAALRAAYAAEIRHVDRLDATHDERRLLTAMFGSVAA